MRLNYSKRHQLPKRKVKKPGKGKTLRRANKKLAILKDRLARPRRVKRLENKIVRLNRALERKNSSG